jgi:hypothetical protein
MIKIIITGVLLAVVVMLAIALRDLFIGDVQHLNRSFKWRIGLSILLLVLVVGTYLAGWLGVSEYAQYL